MRKRTTPPADPVAQYLDPAQGGFIDLSKGPGLDQSEAQERPAPLTLAQRQAAFRARRAAELADLQQQIARLTGSAGTKADQIAAAVAILSDLTARLITDTDRETAGETAASYAAASEITRAKHHAAAALEAIQRNAAEEAALEASHQRHAAREARPRR